MESRWGGCALVLWLRVGGGGRYEGGCEAVSNVWWREENEKQKGDVGSGVRAG